MVSLLISLNNLRIPESILALFLAGMCTSNSFIIMEDQIIQFFTQIMTAAYTFLSSTTPNAITPTQVGIYLIQSILMRLSFDLRRCRPEQWWCYDLSSKSISHSNINFSILFMVITIGLFYYRNYHFVKVRSKPEPTQNLKDKSNLVGLINDRGLNPCVPLASYFLNLARMDIEFDSKRSSE